MTYVTISRLSFDACAFASSVVSRGRSDGGATLGSSGFGAAHGGGLRHHSRGAPPGGAYRETSRSLHQLASGTTPSATAGAFRSSSTSYASARDTCAAVSPGGGSSASSSAATAAGIGVGAVRRGASTTAAARGATVVAGCSADAAAVSGAVNFALSRSSSERTRARSASSSSCADSSCTQLVSVGIEFTNSLRLGIRPPREMLSERTKRMMQATSAPTRQLVLVAAIVERRNSACALPQF